MDTDRPWRMRTYAGHTSASASNALYHQNLAKGQTGLSVAFDLPTQTGYDPDHPMAKGEVGRVGVPISHIGDMRTLFDGIPLQEMNTSMTINATAMWLLALYVAVADEQGADRSLLEVTTQNDILKEYLSRGTHIFPPAPSISLITDMIVWESKNTPRANPINVCSYHLQEAGADPPLEIAFTLANAICVLDAVRETGQVPHGDFEELVGRISFFCNAGIRFVEETCKMRVFSKLWDEITAERYGVGEERYRRFRYGVQVNSLGLTSQQPENNAYRILLEMLSVTLSKDARARSVQLPAWNEALGLPRPWDQQWSLRAQQILAYETDLLEYQDLLDGSQVIETLSKEIEDTARAELERILQAGGSVEALDSMKESLVAAHARRQRATEAGDRTVVGVNEFTQAEPSKLLETMEESAFMTVDDSSESKVIKAIERWRANRDASGVKRALDGLRKAAEASSSLMEPSIDAAIAGVTTGEWSDTLRSVYGEYRAPTGVTQASAAPSVTSALEEVRRRVVEVSERLGARRLRLLIAKPGLDGHSNAAEQVAVRARDAGYEVIYQGIRLTPEEIAAAAADESVNAIGVSILSGAHMSLVEALIVALEGHGIDLAKTPLVVGGVIPPSDAEKLIELGVALVFTPSDYDLTEALAKVTEAISAANP